VAVTVEAVLRAEVEAWIDDDPDERDRAELRALLDGGDGDAGAELAGRFGGRLTFGTAGLRGAVGAGPNRMNRAVVRAATAAVAGWLLDGGGIPEVVVGCDARHRSDEFADEVAAVLAGAGIRVHLLPRPGPTPLLAFAVRQLGTGAGIMITASHNPAADNGYKLYLDDGAQVIPPVDADIEGRIAALGRLSEIRTAALDDPLIVRHGDEVAAAYLKAVTGPAAAAPAAGKPDLRVVYTPMHGVAGDLMLRAMEQAGFGRPHVVKAQADPDPDFPTVAFPNPEEPGALDLALADARALGADLVLASDPDGDRLAVAVPVRAAVPGDGSGKGSRDGSADAAAGWRQLSGDQLGALLGAFLLGDVAGPGEFVATTIVSATLLSKIAKAAGARYRETLTGFKWIARAADGEPGARFVFGYEEALGYQIGTTVRDKDGIGAALAVLRLATAAKQAGKTLAGAYDDLERAHGVHLAGQLSPRIPQPAEVMRRLRAAPPAALGGAPVEAVTDFMDAGTGLPPSDVLRYALGGGARVAVRPSGTEPKIKAYLEVTEPPGDDLAAARAAAAARMAPLRAAVTTLLTS
jgi:phosphomannomutase